MRVVLEVNSVLTNRHSGFFGYGAGLLAGFAALEDPPEITALCGRRVLPNASWLGEAADKLDCRWVAPQVKMRHLERWWQFVSVPGLQRLTGPFHVYHCNHHLMPPTKGKPRVMTVHDLRRYRLPEFYRHSKLGRFEYAVSKADQFIAISQATKSDLQEYFGIGDERIDVVYHGGPLKSQAEQREQDANQQRLERLGLTAGRYFMVFNSYDKRKNLPNTIRAFGIAAAQLGDDFRLAVVGQEPADRSAFVAELEPQLLQRVVFTGPLSEVKDLYEGCSALVYASLYEGFGLPLVEAMGNGAAVITSNCSSMAEVAGAAALLVDPTCPEEIAAAMVKLADDEAVREGLQAAGEKRVKAFSWERAARETLAVYHKLI